jgi:hypothetical protein
MGGLIDSDYRALLASRRSRLVQHAAAQRRQLAQAVVPLAQSARWVERGWLLWREVQRRPWLVALPAGLLLLWRPRAVLRAAAALPLWWRIGQTALRVRRPWRP